MLKTTVTATAHHISLRGHGYSADDLRRRIQEAVQALANGLPVPASTPAFVQTLLMHTQWEVRIEEMPVEEKP